MVIGVAAAAGCSSPQQDGAVFAGAQPSTIATAAEFDVGPVLTPEAYLAAPEFALADIRRGETLSLACIVCHTLEPGGEHLLGPNLGHVFGTAAASKPGFVYSAALAESGLVWTPRALDAWLAAPASFVPGTSMVFAGYSAAEQRRDLIAYLLRATEPRGE